MIHSKYLSLVADVCRFVRENYPHTAVETPKEERVFLPSPPKPVPTPPPKKQEEKPKVVVSKEIRQEVAPAPTAEPIEEFYQLVQRTFPHMKLRKAVPDDREAKKRAEIWKEKRSLKKVALLAFYSSEQELLFLKKLAKAIHQSLAPTQLIHAVRIEKEKKWKTLLEKGDYQLIISFPGEVQRCVELMRLYQEHPKTKERSFGNIPFLLLTPLSNFDHAESKRQLWSQLCQLLKKAPSQV